MVVILVRFQAAHSFLWIIRVEFSRLLSVGAFLKDCVFLRIKLKMMFWYDSLQSVTSRFLWRKLYLNFHIY